MKTDRVFRKLVAVIFAVVCPLQAAVVSAQEQVRATIVWYLEQEAGISPYRVRYIVTGDYLRSDEGRDDGAFTLFDRKLRQIYSVVPENRSVLEVDGNGEPQPKPAGSSVRVVQEKDPQAPLIGGEQPYRLDLVADGTVCHTAMVAAGLLPTVQETLQAFFQALAVQQARILASTPAEYQTPCFLARYLYASDFHWSRGMVLADWNAAGERRELVDYDIDALVPGALFEVPADYLVIPAAGKDD